MTKNYLKFWGTRGSCAVSGPEYAKFGGNTCALEIRYEDQVVIIDTGTGIRPLGRELLKQKVQNIHLFLSHSHWDHLVGFPFFDPIYEPGVHITIWSPPNIRRSYRELFSDLLAPEFFPVRLEQVKADLEFKTTQQKTPISLGGLTIDFHVTNHPGLTYCFKIVTPHKKIGYITDNEMLQGYHGSLDNVPPEIVDPHLGLIGFLTGCDTIVHEAQYTAAEYRQKMGWGHSSVPNAAYLLQKTGAPQWLATHHDPSHTDSDLLAIESDAKALLHQHKIACQAAWIPDSYVLAIH
ncbi:MAG: MBL fold metallo-hydrolase [Verrucomicrobia bacterium]|nr:MBL fold metallo-hydrolase [Verrucomicrobiota bacterium]